MANKTRVLIVDDEQDFARTLAERLVLRNLEATAVTSGEEALAAVQTKVPDVVVLDLKMPDMSGLEVLDRLRVLSPSVAVIMLTGHDSTAAAIEGMKRGVFDYITKPIDIEELVEKIHQAKAQAQ